MDYKAMCIHQGYVPSTCTMEGQMCWLLVNSQGDPCKGCNENRSKCGGRYAPYENKDYRFMCFLDKWDEIDRKQREENEKRHREIIEKRKDGHLNGYTRTILEVKWELLHKNNHIEVLVKDLVDEKVYIAKCRDIVEMLHVIKLSCSKYNVEQIHVETTAWGQSIYNELNNNIKDIDIVPLKYVKMDLFN
jgi:hypothetical protein